MKYEHDTIAPRNHLGGPFERFLFLLCLDGDLHAFRKTPLPFAAVALPLCGKLVDVDPSWEGDSTESDVLCCRCLNGLRLS